MDETSESLFSEDVLSDVNAETEALRCLRCYDPPCVKACPTAVPIPKFISRIVDKDYKGSAQAILNANILGLSCGKSCPTAVLCEGACVHLKWNKPAVAIGQLQAYSVKRAYENKMSFFVPGKDTHKSVGLIGAGPASIACAHELRRYGHDVHIYETKPMPGGLNSTGIAPYKLKGRESLYEISKVLDSMGVTWHFEHTFGEQISFDALQKKHHSLFFGMGLGLDKEPLPLKWVPNKIVGAIQWIKELKTMTKVQWNKMYGYVSKALVIGGGNTAMDVLQELAGLGCQQILGCYRKGPEHMSAYPHESKKAKQQGAQILYNVQIKACEILDSGLIQVYMQVDKEDILWSGDLIISAIGQSSLENVFKKEIPALKFHEKKLMIDEHGRTNLPWIYGGGDLVSGGEEVVFAVAQGKKTAMAIHHDFQNRKDGPL